MTGRLEAFSQWLDIFSSRAHRKPDAETSSQNLVQEGAVTFDIGRFSVALVVFGQDSQEIRTMLEKLAALDGGGMAIYLVQNDTFAVLDEFADRATVIRPGANLGFAGGVNRAAAHARADGHDMMLVLNFDTQFLRKDLLLRLFEPFAMYSNCAFASPTIVYAGDSSLIWYRGGRTYRPAWVTRHPGINTSLPRTGSVTPTDFFSGCCALVDLEVFDALGGFWEHLFMYYEEADICYRAIAIGKRAYHVDLAMVAHAKRGRGFDELEAFQHARNSRLLLARHEHGAARLLGRLEEFLVAPFQLRRCNGAAARIAYLEGLFGFEHVDITPWIENRSPSASG